MSRERALGGRTLHTAICIINVHQHFEFSIGNDEIMQKMPLKSVIFIQKVTAIYIAYCSKHAPAGVVEDRVVVRGLLPGHAARQQQHKRSNVRQFQTQGQMICPCKLNAIWSLVWQSQSRRRAADRTSTKIPCHAIPRKHSRFPHVLSLSG